MSFTPTQEQLDAVEMSHVVRNLKLSALAGSAKTSTCVLIAQANPCPSLYLAFNKTMAQDAAGRFPDWVEVRTTHSLAYRVFGRQYAHKLTRPAGAYQNVGWTGSEVARLLHIPSQIIRSTGEIVTSSSIGACVILTVNNFEHSADKEISKKHVSLLAIPSKKQTRHDFPEKKLRAEILKSAEILWRKRTDLNSPVLISHDTYLKLYQLSNPDLSQYEMIYLDEYQDTNPCVHAIAMQQTKSNMVAVGDKFQAIYGWRSAVNAMDLVSWPESALTKSFRFGQSVADLANEILRDNKTGEYRTKMQGFEKVDTKIMSKWDWSNEKVEGAVTRIYRTNAYLIADAIEDMVAGKNVAIQIDVQNFIKCLESGVALMNGEKSKVKHDVFVGFDSWKEFKEEAEHNQECQKLLRLITGGDVGKILGTLRNYRVPKTFEVKYSTAHKMKGLEDDIVWLADDFPSAYDKNGNWIGLTQEEQNILYVALTRAKKVLVKNSTIEEILCYYQESKESVGAIGVTIGSIQSLDYDLQNDPLRRAIDLETVKLGGRMLDDADLFCEGDNLHPDDPHWENMDMEFGGLPQ